MTDPHPASAAGRVDPGRSPAIVTVTANPSLDRTLELTAPLSHGAVQRAGSVRTEPGGKGVNVARVASAAGIGTRALLPARAGDPLLAALDSVALPYLTLAIDGEVRSNVTIVDPDGTTTKVNAPGFVLDDASAAELTELVLANAGDARWVALCGSLPPGLPHNWYRTVVDALADTGCRVAVDTSGAPLAAAVTGPVDLLKPNEEELAEATGVDPAELSTASARGDHAPLVAAATVLAHRTGAAILATLGAAGALLVTSTGAWFATPPPIVPRSTVGAGDAALTGYLIAECGGAEEPERLRMAVAYGSAATALAGTQPPCPDQIDPDNVSVTDLTGAASAG
ncbi:1-phosphofructokinase family hexose kinase [Gordonia tangerina]|uniref:1-phosphofructokinase family hexose kinase n=1 Tax=Gordonia tangerina TaxID=2911060 RepID=A0ABS9DG41_9ACTN|nr:1-phosphofructokinase family hexose kinase [Gordonia tangerina]MCF3937567.1 1-phosphofructokinase family hexose kinase [Gordonia tangerina]